MQRINALDSHENLDITTISRFHIVRDWGEFGACRTFATKSQCMKK